MNLRQLSLIEKVSLIATRSLAATTVFHEKPAHEIVWEDIKTLRSNLNRVIDLIEECGEAEGTMQ